MINWRDTIFNITTIHTPPVTGDLLVAQPFLKEEWFSRAVISLIDFDAATGATGVVLNNPLACTLDEVLEGVKVKVPVFCGGPLSNDRLFFVHTLGDLIPEAKPYAEGLYIGGDFASITRYVNDGYPIDGCVRFFIGYSGWSRGQLEQEITDNVWAVAPSPENPALLLEGHGDPVWHGIVRTMGPHYKSWTLLPADTYAN